MFFFLNRSEFRQKLIGYVIYAGKTSGVLRGGASGANRCYVLTVPDPIGQIGNSEKKCLYNLEKITF